MLHRRNFLAAAAATTLLRPRRSRGDDWGFSKEDFEKRLGAQFKDYVGMMPKGIEADPSRKLLSLDGALPPVLQVEGGGGFSQAPTWDSAQALGGWALDNGYDQVNVSFAQTPPDLLPLDGKGYLVSSGSYRTTRALRDAKPPEAWSKMLSRHKFEPERFEDTVFIGNNQCNPCQTVAPTHSYSAGTTPCNGYAYGYQQCQGEDCNLSPLRTVGGLFRGRFLMPVRHQLQHLPLGQRFVARLFPRVAYKKAGSTARPPTSCW
jgi:hypothetical protein